MKKLIRLAILVGWCLTLILKPTLSQAYGLQDLKSDLHYLLNQTPVTAILFFIPFGSNPDPNFAKHRMTDDQINEICDSNCSQYNIGANFGTIYKGGNYAKARDHQMNWTLEIAQANNTGSVIDVINSEGIDNVIVRIGVGNNSFGFDNPNAYINFLNLVSSGVGGKTFYAIAGPNEPDIETWSIAGCQPPNGDDPAPVRQAFYDCAGQKLAAYMNAVIAGAPSNVRLLSPAFNMTSFMFNDDTGRPDGIPRAMLRHGANFGALYAVAGNLYPNGDTLQNYWQNQVSAVISELGRPVIITETGPWDSSLTGGGLPSYDTSIYDEYQTSENDFYLNPIRGLRENDVNTIRADLVSQGYQAYCATDRYYTYAQIGADHIVQLFLRLHPSGHTFNFESTQVIDYTNARTPLWRDVADKQFQFASIEEFFGYQDTKIRDASQAEIRSGAVNSLLTNAQRCTQSMALLKTVQDMCNRLDDPTTCALRDRPVPDTEFTYQTLSEAVQALPSNYPAKYKSICQFWQAEHNSPRTQNIITALEQTPLYLDRVYRTAFLVVTLQQIPKEPNKLFNFFLRNNPTASNHEVMVIAFKVPDTGTNNGENTSGSTYLNWADPLTLTRDSLITKQVQENNTTRNLDFISALQSSATGAFNQQASDRIYCMNAGGGQGATTHCDPQTSALGRAVVDIINGQARSPALANKMLCNSITSEESSMINDPASIEPDPDSQTLFTNDFGRQLVELLLPASAQTTLYSDWQINNGTYSNKGQSHITIDTYLVYPVGTELDSVEEALSGAFFTQEELKSLNRDDPYQRQGFAMDDTIQSFTGESDSHTFEDTTKPHISYNDILDPLHLVPIYSYDDETFSGSIGSVIQQPARILGGQLGYWMRIIQLNLHKLVSVPRQYLATCKTTEEFLLGRCQGEDVSPIYIKDTNTVQTDMAEYCGTATDWVTNTSGNFTITQRNLPLADATQPEYFVDNRSSLKIDAKSFVIDGATLVTTNSVVGMNPGQELASRCGGSGSQVKIMYLPDGAYTSDQLNNAGYWEMNASILEYQAPEIKDTPVNVAFNLSVKQGYYKIHLNNAGCFSRDILQVKIDGTTVDDSGKTHYFRLDNNSSLGQAKYCGQIVMNSNMPGNTGTANSSRGCPIDPAYHLDLNRACGGLNSDNENNLWGTLPKVDLPDDTAPALSLPGLARYQQIFNRAFVQPAGGQYMCDDIFPNVIAETDCSRSVVVNPLGCTVIKRQCDASIPNCTQSATSFCAVEYLQEKIEAYATAKGQTLSATEALNRAENASKICQKESRGDASHLNDGCITQSTLDYSVGLYQINMLAHDCSDTFLDYGTATNPFCTLDTSPQATQRRADCVTRLQDPDFNVQRMLELSNGATNWNPWLNAKKQCGIN